MGSGQGGWISSVGVAGVLGVGCEMIKVVLGGYIESVGLSRNGAC